MPGADYTETERETVRKRRMLRTGQENPSSNIQCQKTEATKKQVSRYSKVLGNSLLHSGSWR